MFTRGFIFGLVATLTGYIGIAALDARPARLGWRKPGEAVAAAGQTKVAIYGGATAL